MTHAGYVAAGYVATFGAVIVYAAWVLRRGRRLSAQVSEEDRRWL
jgi:heme exporter protein CcmD